MGTRTPTSRNRTRRVVDWAAIIAAIALLIGMITFLIQQGVINPFSVLPPKFTFKYEQSLSQKEPLFEITPDMSYGGDVLGTIQVVVSVQYSGAKYDGPVIVSIVNQDGMEEKVGGWDDFRNDHSKSVIFRISPAQLFSYAGYILEPNKTFPISSDDVVYKTIKVYVRDLNEEIGESTIRVAFQPWYQTTTILNSVISKEDPIEAIITLHNFGAPALFQIESNLYDATESDPASLFTGNEGWWAGKTWGESIYSDSHVTEFTVPKEKDKPYEYRLTIPKNVLAEGHQYVLETYAIKNLPYVHFAEGDWKTSEESWRCRDQIQFNSVVVLQP